MTTAHTADGDQDIREYLRNNWTFLALVDDQGNEEVRIDIDNDSRATVTSGPASNPLTYEVTVSGSDADISTGVTLSESELYKGSSATTVMSEDTFNEGDATIGTTSDELTVTHDIEQPTI